MTANLANMDALAVGGLANMSDDARAYGNKLSQGIADFNDQQVSGIISGQITESGPALDQRLVVDEQRYIQSQLGNLSSTDRNLYTNFVDSVNRNANISGVLSGLNHVTDYEIATAADRTRNIIGGPIDFANQSHRILMGNQVVNIIRQENQAVQQFNSYIRSHGPKID